jgi:hypothetical protein
MRLIKINLIFIKTKVINKSINKMLSKKIFIKLKKYSNILFLKRFTLYIDFVQK